jgi:hypothetical protein
VKGGRVADVIGKDSIVGNEMQILKRLGFNMQVSFCVSEVFGQG